MWKLRKKARVEEGGARGEERAEPEEGGESWFRHGMLRWGAG